MKLIHTALLCEAMPIIERLKLKKSKKNLYQNGDILVAISGIGRKKTAICMREILSDFHIDKAVNIGIAGCANKEIKIGELFCINKEFKNIPKTTLVTVDEPTMCIDATLVDMEAEAFERVCTEFGVECVVFKVVSDYLDSKIPQKAFVSRLIKESLDKWIEFI